MKINRVISILVLCSFVLTSSGHADTLRVQSMFEDGDKDKRLATELKKKSENTETVALEREYIIEGHENIVRSEMEYVIDRRFELMVMSMLVDLGWVDETDESTIKNRKLKLRSLAERDINIVAINGLVSTARHYTDEMIEKELNACFENGTIPVIIIDSEYNKEKINKKMGKILEKNLGREVYSVTLQNEHAQIEWALLRHLSSHAKAKDGVRGIASTIKYDFADFTNGRIIFEKAHFIKEVAYGVIAALNEQLKDRIDKAKTVTLEGEVVSSKHREFMKVLVDFGWVRSKIVPIEERSKLELVLLAAREKNITVFHGDTVSSAYDSLEGDEEEWEKFVRLTKNVLGKDTMPVILVRDENQKSKLDEATEVLAEILHRKVYVAILPGEEALGQFDNLIKSLNLAAESFKFYDFEYFGTVDDIIDSADFIKAVGDEI
ncbi:MAG: hypothetical protein P9L93_05230 [Candidatus Gorgyraea atricola]|nr:hypothetical protein [Candidatus Gorgyraea atricola]